MWCVARQSSDDQEWQGGHWQLASAFLPLRPAVGETTRPRHGRKAAAMTRGCRSDTSHCRRSPCNFSSMPHGTVWLQCSARIWSSCTQLRVRSSFESCDKNKFFKRILQTKHHERRGSRTVADHCALPNIVLVLKAETQLRKETTCFDHAGKSARLCRA